MRRLRQPPGWEADEGFATLRLEAGGRGEIALPARAPAAADGVRRLMTAEVLIDGRSQGPGIGCRGWSRRDGSSHLPRVHTKAQCRD